MGAPEDRKEVDVISADSQRGKLFPEVDAALVASAPRSRMTAS